MLLRRALLMLLLVCAIACDPGCAKAGGGGGSGGGGEAIRSESYDLLVRTYGRYVDHDDPLAFPMKVRALAANRQAFWRGGKDVFYTWCATHCRDWLDEPANYVACHGDLHSGNIGAYPPADDPLGKLAFGEVDFDDSARLPYQIELLHGLVSLELAARSNDMNLSPSRRTELTRTLLDAYRAARANEPSADLELAEERDVRRLLDKAGKGPYAETVEKYTDGAGRFRPVVEGGDDDDEVKEILRPVTGRDDAFAAALAQAIANAPELKQRLRFADAAGARTSIRAVALRTRLGSAGSQGLRKYLLLMRSPLRDYDGDAILYLKQQIPAAAERAGLIPRDARPPGQRCADFTAALTEPNPLLNSWCEFDGGSYAVLLKEPWSDELSTKKLKNEKNLTRAARLWGTVAGRAHFLASGRQQFTLPDDVAEALARQLEERAAGCLQSLAEDYDNFVADPRVKRAVKVADNAIDRAS